ncbi:hypothetical protein GW17_00032611 [Ensete ventricosum]|nr:hypothetical protein GW17_00032611 [Ensete ventricosum]
MAAVTSSASRGWSGSVWRSVPESVSGRSGDMGPPSSAKNDRDVSGACLVDASAVRALALPVYPAGYLRRVGHVDGPAVRGCDDLATRKAAVPLPSASPFAIAVKGDRGEPAPPSERDRGEAKRRAKMSGNGVKKVAEVAAKATKSIDWDGMAKLIVSDGARKEFANLRRSFDEVNNQLQTKFSQSSSFAGIEIPKYVDTVTPEYKPKFDALVRDIYHIDPFVLSSVVFVIHKLFCEILHCHEEFAE